MLQNKNISIWPINNLARRLIIIRSTFQNCHCATVLFILSIEAMRSPIFLIVNRMELENPRSKIPFISSYRLFLKIIQRMIEADQSVATVTRKYSLNLNIYPKLYKLKCYKNILPYLHYLLFKHPAGIPTFFQQVEKHFFVLHKAA